MNWLDSMIGRAFHIRVLSVAILCALAVMFVLCDRSAAADDQPVRLPDLITPEAQRAIDDGLAYLARVQSRDGAWRNMGGYGRYPVAMTGLAGWALLMDGNTTTQGKYAPQVDRAARFLVGCARPSGLIARVEEDEGRPMYGHGFSMLFLAELYGMSEDPAREREIHDVLVKGVELCGRSQSRLGGWIYEPTGGGDEGSVTITQVQALRACRNAGIAVPKQVIDNAMNYLVLSSRSDGGIAYRANMQGQSRPALTAAAVCCWFNAGDYDNPLAAKALEYCKQHIDPARMGMGHYFYTHLYYAQALNLAGAEPFAAYYPNMRDRLLLLQDPNGSWNGDRVGQVYGTAVALIILQLPRNQLPIMQR